MNLSLNVLGKRILKDKYNSIIFKKSRGRELYLVGGYIRDIFRGIYSNDRDFIVDKEIDKFVEELNKIFHGTIISFKKGNLKRIVLKNGTTFDFSKPQGTLHEDLSKRDFTINSIAWSPLMGIIDPYNGLNDIGKRIIKCISIENLNSDPLRIIRAYRFAAELNGSIETNTRNALKLLNSSINTLSSERITLEVFNLLNSEHAAKYLEMAFYDSVLRKVFYNSYKTLQNNLRVIYKLERTIKSSIPNNLKALLNKTFSQNLSYKGLLCLEILMRNIRISKSNCYLLKLSNHIKKRIELFQRGDTVYKNKDINLQKKLFDIFNNAKAASIDLIIIERKFDLLNDYRRYLRINKKSVLKTNEIINICDIHQGKMLGYIIKELRRAEFERRVKNRNMAITYVKNIKDNILHNISYQT